MSAEPTILREPWQTLSRQREAATFGIWIFIATEVLFFGGFFLLYATYRVTESAGFIAAARETNIWFGTANTALLLTSSLTMAVASQAAEVGLRRLTLIALSATIAFGLAFLVVKGFEYREDIEKHLVPGPTFSVHNRIGQIFFALYWVMTAVHAIHLSIGLALIARLIAFARLDLLKIERNPEVEVTALYWHLVDIIWIFLYPLLYLVGRT
jgi:cytochrome c oxidase subunit 3